MNAPLERTWKTIESGPHNLEGSLHPVVVKNYGKWKYHKLIKPGVMVHYGLSGDALYTVRAGTPRQNTVDLVRGLCDLADQYADGFMRFTIRNSVEFMFAEESRIDPLIKDLEDMGLPVGGIANCVAPIAHTQGWLHCDIPATDASGVAKGVMDNLYDEFKTLEMPNKVRLSTSCCSINCGGRQMSRLW